MKKKFQIFVHDQRVVLIGKNLFLPFLDLRLMNLQGGGQGMVLSLTKEPVFIL